MSYPRTRVEVRSRGAIITGRTAEPMARAQRSWLQGVLKRIRDDVRMFAPVDLGTFRRSVIYRTTRRGTVVEGEVFSTDTAAKQAVIEYGRRPGSRMPPKGALAGWMARHGIPAKFEYIVRRNIADRGIPAQQPFAKAFAKSRGLLNSQQRTLASAIVAALNR